jgi:hypothetical protein
MTDLKVVTMLSPWGWQRTGPGSPSWMSSQQAAGLIMKVTEESPSDPVCPEIRFDFCGFIDLYYPNQDPALLFARWLV